MINILGKTLVFLHLMLSVAALIWAASLYLQFTDWGWKEPRQSLDARIPSEYDKSAAALKFAVRARDLVSPAVKPARESLSEAEKYFPQNHFFYVSTLRELQDSTEPTIEVRDLKTPGIPLDTPLGVPVLDAKIEGLTKSQKAYQEDLKKVTEEVQGVEKDIRDILKKTQETTFALTGKDDAGKRVTFGLYDLVDAEFESLSEARREKEEIKPHWAHYLEEARLYRLRRNVLEQTLSRLQAASDKRK